MGNFHKTTNTQTTDNFFRTHNYTRTPTLVQWMATYSCKLSCKHCLCGDNPSTNELTLKEVEHLLDQVRDLGVKEFLVTGGEPLERKDLPEIINMMAEREIPWSLNTATSPNPKILKAIKTYPPFFVAVSLDGPKSFHNQFRGSTLAFQKSMQSIAIFSQLVDGEVAAGTTVHSQNIDLLTETYQSVLESGATSWGIHLTFPEGRANNQKDLLLNKKQLQKLLSFIASKRHYFPVSLADEMGYCGSWEPLVRQGPVICGAGRSQCVVLPDGEVVPCSTVDHSESAGNIRNISLEKIWRSGFASIREEILEEKCNKCSFMPVCSGGCWLQRRHGKHCFKHVWQLPRALNTAASLAACLSLGFAGCQHSKSVTPSNEESVPSITKSICETTKDLKLLPPNTLIAKDKDKNPLKPEQIIIHWALRYTGRTPFRAPSSLEQMVEELGSDPAGIYLTEFIKENKLPGLSEGMDRVSNSLKTEYRSMAFAALLWREFTLQCFSSQPQNRSEAENTLLRETLLQLEHTSEAWRLNIFEDNLDTYISTAPANRKPAYGSFMMKKSAPRYEDHLKHQTRALSLEHFGMSTEKTELSKSYLLQHPFGEGIKIPFEIGESQVSEVVMVTNKGCDKLPTKESLFLGIFDILVLPEDRDITITIPANDKSLKAILPGGSQLFFGDIIRLVYEQNKEELEKVLGNRNWNKSGYPLALFLPLLQNPSTPKDKSKAIQLWLF